MKLSVIAMDYDGSIIHDERAKPLALRLGYTVLQLGSMVLAWDEAKRGAADPADDANLVPHEFVHQLDFEDSQTDGAPALATRAEYLTWERVVSREFEALRAAEEGSTHCVGYLWRDKSGGILRRYGRSVLRAPARSSREAARLVRRTGAVLPPGSCQLFFRSCELTVRFLA